MISIIQNVLFILLKKLLRTFYTFCMDKHTETWWKGTSLQYGIINKESLNFIVGPKTTHILACVIFLLEFFLILFSYSFGIDFLCKGKKKACVSKICSTWIVQSFYLFILLMIDFLNR